MPHASRLPQRAAFAQHETEDAAIHGQCVTGWHHVYEQIERRPFRGSLTELVLGSIQIFHETLNQPVAYRGTSWIGSLVFMCPRPSPGSFFLNGREVEQHAIGAWPRNFLHNGSTNGPTDNLVLAIDQDFLSRHSMKTLGRDLVAEVVGHTLLIVDPQAIDMFHEHVGGILETVARRPGCLEDERFCADACEHLLKMLLRMLTPNGLKLQQMPHPSTRSYIVDKTIEYMDAHLSDAITISDLCAAARVRPRTLRYSFEDIVGVSPMQFLLARRLSCVRRELMQAGSSNLVYCIAQRYGFSHMGRFAQFYSAAFGERPSDTCRRADAPSTDTFRTSARATSHAIHRIA